MLKNKIDFAVIFSVKNANPNGDPLNGNRPRANYAGVGEVSDVCLKRKLRDRLLEQGQAIFVQSDDRKVDDCLTLKARAESEEYGLGGDIFNSSKTQPVDSAAIARKACEKWLDVRAFGQLFAFKKGKKSDGNKEDGVSVGIRGPVSIHPAFSVERVDVSSIQITKSVSSEGDGKKKSSDTMGMKHRVDHATYVFYGTMNPQLAEKTLFSDEDANMIKNTLPRLFENDASSARPEGSMVVEKVIWWPHNCKSGQYSSARVHKLLTVNPDGSYELGQLEDLLCEEMDGF